MPAVARADRAKARALLERGQELQSAGDTVSALTHYERAVQEDGDYLPAYDAAIPHWIYSGHYDRIIEHMERVTTRYPEYATGWYALAYAYRRRDKPRLAIAAYQAYISLRPGDATPFFGLAMAHKSVGQAEDARAAFLRYIDMERDSSRKAFVDRARQELQALGGQLVRPVKAPVAEPELLARALQLAAAGRLASAEIAARGFDPSSPAEWGALWLLRARIALGRGQPGASLGALALALGSEAPESEVYRLMAAAYRQLGRSQEAAYFDARAAAPRSESTM